jgi:Ran-binding protein 1
MSDDAENAGGAGGEGDSKHLEEENQTEYEPVLHLKPVAVDSGESEENVIYKQRCALYRHVAATDKDPAQWKERGKGDIRFLQHKANKMVRIVLREEKTLKLRCNHVIHPQIAIKPNAGSDRFWAWRTEDYAEEPPITETFGIKFKTPEIANEFKAKWDECRKINAGVISKDGKLPVAAASTAATTSATAAAGTASKDGKDDKSVDALTKAVGAASISDAGQSTWDKILAERKFAPLTEENIRKLWSTFDTNNDNKIDSSELTNLLSSLLKAVLKTLSVPITADVQSKMDAELPSLVAKALQRLDTNKDGTVSWEEFKAINEVKMISAK